MLGSLKIEDDLRDKPGLASRLTHLVFHKLFGRAQKNLISRDPALQRKLTTAISALNAVEAQDVRASLDAFCQPSVSGLMAILDLLARQLDLPEESPISRLAAPIARAIVSFDQAIDFDRDRQGGGYTVLTCESDRQAAFEHARRQIEEARSISLAWLGPDSLASEILDGFQRRIESSLTELQRPRTPQPWRPSLRTLRTFYWTALAVFTPAVAMAASADDDDWCSNGRCCCFCLGYLCGEGSSQARK